MPGPNGEECEKCQCFFKVTDPTNLKDNSGACKAVAPTFAFMRNGLPMFAYPGVRTTDWCIHNFKIKDEYIQ